MLIIENIGELVGNYLFRWRVDSVEVIKHRDVSNYCITLTNSNAKFPAYIHIGRKVHQLYSKFVFVSMEYGLETVEEGSFTLEELGDKVTFLTNRINKLNEFINSQ